MNELWNDYTDKKLEDNEITKDILDSLFRYYK